LGRHWGLRDLKLDYLPVGFGSHHWSAVDARGARRFVTVDDLEAGFQAGPDTDSAFSALDRAFRTAAALRDEAELDFVVAPLSDGEGVVIRRLSDRYAVTVSPFIDGDTSTWGPYESADDRRRMGGVLGRLHAATEHVPAGLPRKEELALPPELRSRKPSSISINVGPPAPFAEPARQLLQASAQPSRTAPPGVRRTGRSHT
jgi:spectinomycin phosphotransferase